MGRIHAIATLAPYGRCCRGAAGGGQRNDAGVHGRFPQSSSSRDPAGCRFGRELLGAAVADVPWRIADGAGDSPGDPWHDSRQVRARCGQLGAGLPVPRHHGVRSGLPVRLVTGIGFRVPWRLVIAIDCCVPWDLVTGIECRVPWRLFIGVHCRVLRRLITGIDYCVPWRLVTVGVARRVCDAFSRSHPD